MLFNLLLAVVMSMSWPNGTIDGYTCEPMEGLAWHIHAHLTIINHGHRVAIPQGIGINKKQQCIYAIHTHANDGIIHVEANEPSDISLATFFHIWRQPLTTDAVANARRGKNDQIRTYVNGRLQVHGAGNVVLAERQDIVILVGPPYKLPPPFTDWNSPIFGQL